MRIARVLFPEHQVFEAMIIILPVVSDGRRPRVMSGLISVSIGTLSVQQDDDRSWFQDTCVLHVMVFIRIVPNGV